MFPLEVDVVLKFAPPMLENFDGIRLTRSFDLPFSPSEGLYLTGAALNDYPSHEGFKLEDVTYDVDRGVFLASTSLTEVNLPLAWIPAEIRSWQERGWRIGSLADAYETGAKSRNPRRNSERLIPQGFDDEEADQWPHMPSRMRPAWFNLLLRVLVHEMAAKYNNWDVAYAIDQTKFFFSDSESKGTNTPAARKFQKAQSKFARMSTTEQMGWQGRALRRNPSLREVMG